MKSLDTNILVRYYVQDEPRQGAIATRIMTTEPELFVSKTVVAELEWVLRGYYELMPDKIHAALVHLLRLGNVTVEQGDTVEAALRYYQLGIDFTDALHLASSQHCATLLTFDDKKFARRAKRLGLKPPVTVPASSGAG